MCLRRREGRWPFIDAPLSAIDRPPDRCALVGSVAAKPSACLRGGPLSCAIGEAGSGGNVTQSGAPARYPIRRGLIGLIGIAIAVLGILVASQIGTLFPGGAVAATIAPGRSPSPAPSPTGIAAEASATPAPPTEPPPSQPPPLLVPAPLTGLL